MEAVTEDKGYLSPASKLLTFFEKSRNRWKTKALERKQHVRRLEKRIVELEASRRKWREKAQAQRASSLVRSDGKQKGA
jgi:hypothetical protein